MGVQYSHIYNKCNHIFAHLFFKICICGNLGSADNSLRFWDVASGRCLGVVKFSHAVKDVAWNPSTAVSCIAAAVYDTRVSSFLAFVTMLSENEILFLDFLTKPQTFIRD